MKKKDKIIKEDFKLKFAKQNLEHKKEVYETYLTACIKYEPAMLGYSAVKADKLYHDELLRLMDKSRKQNKFLMRMMFGDPNQKKLTEIEKLQKEEKHYDRLIKLVENRIEGMSHETKMKMAKDAIEKMDAWFGLFKYDNELNGAINKEKE